MMWSALFAILAIIFGMLGYGVFNVSETTFALVAKVVCILAIILFVVSVAAQMFRRAE